MRVMELDYPAPESRPERDPDADMEAYREFEWERERFDGDFDEPTGPFDFDCFVCRKRHSTDVRH